MGRRPSLAVVVQRYGADINGGAELHARYIAERLTPHADVRVLTTCARNYVTWRNEMPAGLETVNGVPVERFPVRRERDASLVEFGRHSTHVFHDTHSLDDELTWLDAQGPVAPELTRRLNGSGTEFDFVLIFSLRYATAYFAARAVPDRALLVPTMEREAAMGLSLFPPVLRGVRAIMYNSMEERAQLQAASSNQHVPGVVVGVGSEIPERTNAQSARARFKLENPFILYVGRIDVNKGCAELFDLFLAYLNVSYLRLKDRPLDLVLVGTPVMPIPEHPHIRHVGFVSDAEKFDLLAAAEVLVMPSYYESLSMVALEAWALGRPVLVNAHCDVLLGQCLRSNAGLYYETAEDFAGALDAILDDPALANALGERGRRYFAEHYRWPVIERKYLDMIQQLNTNPPTHQMEPIPGHFERRRRDCPPALDVLRRLPSGPVRLTGIAGHQS